VKAFIPRIVLSLLMLTLAGCANRGMLNALAPDSGYQLSRNIVYDSQHGLRLDVYAPNDAHDAPVVVFFHGGRWERGDKDDDIFVGAALASRGIVAVLANYRLYPDARYPAFLDDCADAVAWTHANIDGYGGSANRIVVGGFASGAYNAVMLALDPEFMKKAGGSRAWLRGAIGLAGPYDFMPITDPTLRDIFGPPEHFGRTQPVFWARGDNPPLLLIAGADDKIVPPANTQKLFDRVKSANGPVEKIIYRNMDHAKTLNVVSTTLSGQADVLANMVHFVDRVTSQPQDAGN
jgi:Esterase/lipase